MAQVAEKGQKFAFEPTPVNQTSAYKTKRKQNNTDHCLVIAAMLGQRRQHNLHWEIFYLPQCGQEKIIKQSNILRILKQIKYNV